MRDNILVINESNETLSSILRQLSKIGYPLEDIHVCNGMPHPDTFNINPPELLFVETSNSPSSAVDSIKRLKSQFEESPIIALTTNTDLLTKSNFIAAGAQDCLYIPDLNVVDLEMVISFACERNLRALKDRKAFIDYKMHFDNGPMPMWVVDEPSRRFLDVNNAAVLKYGYSREEFLNMRLDDIRPNEDLESMLESYNRVKGGYHDAGYWRHKKKDGEVFYVHIYSHETEIVGRSARLSFSIDVNEKILMERHNRELTQELIEQKESLDNILFSINQAIWSIRTDTDEMVYGNEACTRIFGHTPEELIKDGNIFLNSIHHDDRLIYFAALKEAKINGRAEAEFRYSPNENSHRILKTQATFRKGINGKPDTISGLTVDITEEKALQAKIRQSEQNLKATINNTNDLIWSVDANLNIIYCNHSYRDFVFGLAGIIPKPGDYVLDDWGSSSYIDKRKRDYHRALHGESFTGEIEEEYNGKKVWKEVSTNPIINHEGKITGVNCIARDISEQRLQMIQIREQHDRLKEIAWIQSHKVRGPVASILGLMELINLYSEDETLDREILKQMHQATNDLDNVIKEVVNKTISIERKSALAIPNS
jgi:PAS domain S-box-containing protein